MNSISSVFQGSACSAAPVTAILFLLNCNMFADVSLDSLLRPLHGNLLILVKTGVEKLEPRLQAIPPRRRFILHVAIAVITFALLPLLLGTIKSWLLWFIFDVFGFLCVPVFLGLSVGAVCSKLSAWSIGA